MAKKLVVSEDYSPIFNRIISACQSKKTTVSALLDQFATSRGTINTWKKGNISAETIASIADALDVSLDYLIRGEEILELSTGLTTLSDAEKKLITDYRLLSEQGQKYILHQMLMASDYYKKQVLSGSDMKVG